MNRIDPIPTAHIFKAVWNETNRHLNPEKTLLQKIARVVWDIISVLIPIIAIIRLIGYAIGKLATRFILPAAFYSEQDKLEAKQRHNAIWNQPTDNAGMLQVRAHFKAEPQIVLTPDGAALDATFIRHRNGNENTPTIICPQPNATLAKQNGYFWLIAAAIAHGYVCNFVFFDYRSVGDSIGSFKRMDDLIVDGSSILQWVQTKTPSEQIRFLGSSLGGAVAVNTHALDPLLSNRNANIRSLSSTEDIIHAHGENMNIKKIAKFLAKVVKNQGYYLDAVAPFRKISGPTMVAYHPRDKIIPKPASLAQKVEDVAHEIIVLESLPELVYTNRRYGHHNAPLMNYRVQGTEQNALDRISRFIFGLEPAAVQAQAG